MATLESKPHPLETLATKPHPYGVKLGDGRLFVVELPAAWVAFDPDGEIILRPPAVRFVERARAALVDLPDRPSPGMIRRLREALGMTQAELGGAIGVDKLTVSRWERGETSPRLSAVKAMRGLRRSSARRGTTVRA